MKKAKKLSISVFLSLLALLLCIGTFPFYVSAESGTAPEGEAPVFSTYSGPWDGVSVSTSLTGDGLTEETAYIIATPADLAYLGLSSHSDKYTDKYFRLTANIDMGGYNLYSSENNYMIGDSSSAFAGTFDGQGYTISNFSAYGAGAVGLFSIIGGATIKNLCVNAAQIGCESSDGTASTYAGGIVGRTGVLGGTITNCNVFNTTVKATTHIGGIVGSAQKTTISNCVNSATVSDIENNTEANLLAGGIIGSSWAVLNKDKEIRITIENCVNYGSVSVTDEAKKVSGIKSAGGIIGAISQNDTVNSCINFGTVYAESTSYRVTSGGIVGRLRSADFDKSGLVYITNCLNLSDNIAVSGGTSNVGLINGYTQTNTLTLTGNSSVQTASTLPDAEINGASHASNAVLTAENNIIVSDTESVSTLKQSAAEKIGTVSASMSFKPHIAGVQENTSASSMRFIMCLDSLDYQSVEFRITASYTEGGVQKTAYNGYSPITSVYSSINAGGQTVTPIEFGGKYFATMCVTGIPSGVGDIVFTVNAYVKDLSGNVILVDCGTCTYSSGS